MYQYESKKAYENSRYGLDKNHEGYPDPTAYEAITHADAQRTVEFERHRKLIGCILRICELAGYSVESRISVRDLRTGKVWE